MRASRARAIPLRRQPRRGETGVSLTARIDKVERSLRPYRESARRSWEALQHLSERAAAIRARQQTDPEYRLSTEDSDVLARHCEACAILEVGRARLQEARRRDRRCAAGR